jgi:DNA polymerase III subunit epsilon
MLRARAADGAARAYAKARLPRRDTPWREARYCVVDLELSGLDPRVHEIVSFCAIPVDDGRLRLAGSVHGLARPTRPLPEAAIRVHGIRAADLANAPPIAEAVRAILPVMSGRILVAHHASIERAFLGRALRSAGVRMRGPVIDTAVLARLWIGERDGTVPARMTLGALAGACGLPAHSPHTAVGDTLTTAQLFIATATQLDTLRRETIHSLATANRRLDALAAFPPMTRRM